jgi:hypothetical protein
MVDVMSRGVRRVLAGVMLLGVVVLTSSCHLQIGCRVYRLFEPTPTSGLTVDDSACTAAPPPVVPEAPVAILLPAVGLGAAGVVLVRRRRRPDA